MDTENLIRLQPETLVALRRYAVAEHGPLGWRRVELRSLPELGAMSWSDRSGDGRIVGEAFGLAAMPADPDAWVLTKARAEAYFAAKRMRAEAESLLRRAEAIEDVLRDGGIQ